MTVYEYVHCAAIGCGVGGRGYNPSHKGGDAERYVLQEECDAAANMNKIQIQPVIFVVKNK